MKRAFVSGLFLCLLLSLAACGAGKAETVAGLQSALKQADELESVAVAFLTTTTSKTKDETESIQSTRTCWRDGENVLQEYFLPVMDGVVQSETPIIFATLNGIEYQKHGQEWTQVDTTADFSWNPLLDVPSDADQYDIEKDGNTYILKYTEEANTQEIAIEGWENTRIVQRETSVSVDGSNTATGCIQHLILQNDDENQTTELTTEWTISSMDQSEVAARINEAVNEIGR